MPSLGGVLERDRVANRRLINGETKQSGLAEILQIIEGDQKVTSPSCWLLWFDVLDVQLYEVSVCSCQS